MTYFEFTNRFPTEDAAVDYIVAKKFHDGYVCPKCGCVHNLSYYFGKIMGIKWKNLCTFGFDKA